MNSRESDTRLRSTAPPDAHEHGWCLESRHATSAGYVLYVRCGTCGTRRVDVQERLGAPPEALSVELRPPG
ncbi:hypothetical protein [Leucobacter sp.]